MVVADAGGDMTAPADLVLTDAVVHPLADESTTSEAVAFRDGRVVRVGSAYEVGFLVGTETRVVDCDGATVLPGFVDAHTHLETLGQTLVHADLSGADSPSAAVARLRARAAEVPADEWVLGFRFDESEWAASRYLTREDLDAVDHAAPVVAFREDLHLAVLDSTALDRLRDRMPEGDVRTEGGRPTGVVVEDALDAVRSATAPDPAETRRLLRAAQSYANERGVVGVHDMVRRSHAPRVYRDMAAAGELTLRVRLNYWADHVDALREVGLRTGHGSGLVEVGAVKAFSDGSIGSRTARLSTPYADAPDERGQWVVAPAELRELATAAGRAGYQVAVHAIGDEAVRRVVDVLADAPGERHRVEHLELADDDVLSRMREAGLVASMQPNFHRWAGEGGLYDVRLGADRRRRSNRLRAVLDAGVPLAFGSDCMPLDPLFGVACAVDAPTEEGSVSTTEALRAYTRGPAYAASAADRRGTLEPGMAGDAVVLAQSPWETDDVAGVDVVATVVAGDVVYDAR
jgi:hypothetical protein